MHGKVQTGCELGILENIDETNVSVSTFFEDSVAYKKIDKICPYLREKKIDNIEDEVFIKFTIVIKDTDGNLSKLKQTLHSVAKLRTKKDYDIIIASSKLDINDMHSLASNFFLPKRLRCLKLLEELYNDSIDDEAFKLSKNGWIMFIDSGYWVHPELLEAISYSENRCFSLIGATKNPKAYPCFLYKALGGNKEKPIEEKLLELNETIFESGEIIENYRLDSK